VQWNPTARGFVFFHGDLQAIRPLPPDIDFTYPRQFFERGSRLRKVHGEEIAAQLSRHHRLNLLACDVCDVTHDLNLAERKNRETD
jgi:hypothetical protein